MMAAGLAALASMSPARAAVPPPAPCLAEAASARGPSGAVDIVPAERLAVLARGVNVGAAMDAAGWSKQDCPKR